MPFCTQSTDHKFGPIKTKFHTDIYDEVCLNFLKLIYIYIQTLTFLSSEVGKNISQKNNSQCKEYLVQRKSNTCFFNDRCFICVKYNFVHLNLH